MLRSLIVGVLVGFALGGCATDPALEQAGRSVSTAWMALHGADDQVHRAEETGGGEGVAEARFAVERAEVRLREVEEVLRIWQDTGTGRAAWETYAPCLASALARLDRALEAAHLPEPEDLDQAREMVGPESRRGCGERETEDREPGERAPPGREPGDG